MESTESYRFSYWVVVSCYTFSLSVLYTLALYQARVLWRSCQERYEQLCRRRDLEVLQGFQPIHPNCRVEQWLTAQGMQQAQALEQQHQQRLTFPWTIVRHSQVSSRPVARFKTQAEAALRAAELRDLLPADAITVEHDPPGWWRRLRTKRTTRRPCPHSKRKRL